MTIYVVEPYFVSLTYGDWFPLPSVRIFASREELSAWAESAGITEKELEEGWEHLGICMRVHTVELS